MRPGDYDIVMIHFVGKGFVTCREIGRIRKPIVWLLHDMWPFCGAEHYPDEQQRPQEGYTRNNRPENQRGLDLDRRLWQAKAKRWRTADMTVIGASQWISQVAQKSRLFANSRHGVIPYPLNTRIYQPQDGLAARKLFSLPTDRKLVLFGAVGALKDQRKGFDLLAEALRKLRSPVELVVFGNRVEDRFNDLNVRCHPLGMLGDDYSLAMLYSAADVMAVPSRMDNLPQTVLESLACGTPCVAFNVGGMPDMIEHRGNGFLASPYSTDEFATGLEWVLESESAQAAASERARLSAVKLCNQESIGAAYIDLFKNILASAPATLSR
jgi:glycosyltransferase involved in cell wall biosynthesis